MTTDPVPSTDRRSNGFAEHLSIYIVVIAALGAFLVLLDPRVELVIGVQKISIGGEGFSSELKGAVITIMLIGGWTAAVSYWLGNTESGKKQQESISRIAEAAPAVIPQPASLISPIPTQAQEVPKEVPPTPAPTL